MKRIVFAVLTVALVLSLLIGCTGPATLTATPSPTTTSASPTPTSDVAIGVWEQLLSFGGDVECLVIDPSNPQTLYAGTGFVFGATLGGVCKSTNGGASWAASSDGLRDKYVNSLSIDPSNPQTLYAGTSGDGVWKSSDGGASWVAFSSGLTSSWVYSLIIDPSNPQTLYAGTGDGVYRMSPKQ